MNVKNLFRMAVLIAGCALLILSICLFSFFAYAVYVSYQPNTTVPRMGDIPDALTRSADGYQFDERTLTAQNAVWAILIDENGDVIWSAARPDDVPTHYTISQVAQFSKWYLADYPVLTHIREDGLLVVGWPKHSVWKYNVEHPQILMIPTIKFAFVMVLLSLLCVIGLSALLLRRWFRREQQTRDEVRASWITGISHDIRTPLSLVMGYAGDMEQDAALPDARRQQAGIIRRQSETIKNLVSDLNLTMKLDYAMQPLRRTLVNPCALLREAAASLLNSGLSDCYTLHLDVPDGSPTLFADEMLIKRALQNLLNNCIIHNPSGCAIYLRATCKRSWHIQVESIAPQRSSAASHSKPRAAAPDDTVPHGTGLKLVRQIARAHGGRAIFYTLPGSFCCELILPKV